MLRTKILGTGTYVPARVVTNDDLSKMMDTSDEWIFQRRGIRQRDWAELGESTSSMAFRAAEKALQVSGVKKEELDMILLATLSPDHEFPGTACFLQERLA